MTREDTSKVCLRGYLAVPEDMLHQVRQALPVHIALTRAEKGCISFEVVEDADCPGRFNVSEVFENRAAFEAHQQRTIASNWFEVTQGIPRDYSVTTELDGSQ